MVCSQSDTSSKGLISFFWFFNHFFLQLKEATRKIRIDHESSNKLSGCDEFLPGSWLSSTEKKQTCFSFSSLFFSLAPFLPIDNTHTTKPATLFVLSEKKNI